MMYQNFPLPAPKTKADIQNGLNSLNAYFQRPTRQLSDVQPLLDYALACIRLMHIQYPDLIPALDSALRKAAEKMKEEYDALSSLNDNLDAK